MDPKNRLCTADLDALLDAHVLGGLMGLGKRMLGTEYERLILHRETGESAPMEFCRGLFLGLDLPNAEPLVDGDVVKGLKTEDFEFSMEPGGQLEVSSAPLTCLADIDAAMARATAVVDGYLKNTPFELVCLGHAPQTRVEDIELLPRERYRIMAASMPKRGPLTPNMMRATAGFQLTYDLTDRDDAARKLSLLYRLSPLLMAITANSRMIAGEDSGWASYRHKVWWETDVMRSGIPAGSMHAETAIEGYLTFAKRAQMLFLHRETGLIEAPTGSLETLVAAGEVSHEDLEGHLSTLFPFVRLRNYIEIRCLDSVEWSLARSVLALISGIVYCPDATRLAETLSAQLLIEDAGALRTFHLLVAKDGLSATTPSGIKLSELASELILYAASTLGGGDCNWSLPEDLDEVKRVVAASASA